MYTFLFASSIPKCIRSHIYKFQYPNEKWNFSFVNRASNYRLARALAPLCKPNPRSPIPFITKRPSPGILPVLWMGDISRPGPSEPACNVYVHREGGEVVGIPSPPGLRRASPTELTLCNHETDAGTPRKTPHSGGSPVERGRLRVPSATSPDASTSPSYLPNFFTLRSRQQRREVSSSLTSVQRTTRGVGTHTLSEGFRYHSPTVLFPRWLLVPDVHYTQCKKKRLIYGRFLVHL